MYQACGHFVNPDVEFSDLGGRLPSLPGGDLDLRCVVSLTTQ